MKTKNETKQTPQIGHIGEGIFTSAANKNRSCPDRMDTTSQNSEVSSPDIPRTGWAPCTPMIRVREFL